MFTEIRFGITDFDSPPNLMTLEKVGEAYVLRSLK